MYNSIYELGNDLNPPLSISYFVSYIGFRIEKRCCALSVSSICCNANIILDDEAEIPDQVLKTTS